MLTCSLAITGEVCGLPAISVLIVQEDGRTASAFPRCAIHGAEGCESLVKRMYPLAITSVIPVPLPVR